MTFEYSKPFRTMDGDIVSMKALISIHGAQLVEVIENNRRYDPGTLTPLTAAEYQAHLDWMAELSMLEE